MIPNDYVLLRAYAIGLTAFERRDRTMLQRAVILMHNRAIRLGLTEGNVLRLWTLTKGNQT